MKKKEAGKSAIFTHGDFLWRHQCLKSPTNPASSMKVSNAECFHNRSNHVQNKVKIATPKKSNSGAVVVWLSW